MYSNQKCTLNFLLNGSVKYLKYIDNSLNAMGIRILYHYSRSTPRENIISLLKEPSRKNNFSKTDFLSSQILLSVRAYAIRVFKRLLF
jgi:hypothetical protein